MASSAPALSSQLTLFGSWLCPFVHRVWITVLEKNIPFTWVEIDLKNKPDWFLGVNPVGKVPVIGYKDAEGEHIINESMTLLEFLEDYTPEPAMLPAHPASRAHARNLISLFSEKVIPLFYKVLTNKDPAADSDVADQLTQALEHVQAKMTPGGPYFTGENFTMVDAAILPWLLRLPVVKEFRGYELPESLDALKQYIAASNERPSVQQSCKAPDSDDYIGELIKAYTGYGSR
jgi:glutathione S-transferase